MSTIDFRTDKASAKLDELLNDARAIRNEKPTYKYFSMYYPGRRGGGLALESDIKTAWSLPNFRDLAADPVLGESMFFDASKTLVVHVNIRELYEAAQSPPRYTTSSTILHSISDANPNTSLPDILKDADRSFHFVFYLHRQHEDLSRQLQLIRWGLFSKMHDWRPDDELRFLHCIVNPISWPLAPKLVALDFTVDQYWQDKLRVMLRQSSRHPHGDASSEEIDDRLWTTTALSRDLWLVKRMRELSEPRNNNPFRPSYTPPNQDGRDYRSLSSMESSSDREGSDPPTPPSPTPAGRTKCPNCPQTTKYPRCRPFLRHLKECRERNMPVNDAQHEAWTRLCREVFAQVTRMIDDTRALLASGRA